MALKLKKEKTEKVETSAKPSRTSRSKKARTSKKAKSKKAKTKREGTKVSGDGTYPSVPYMFDEMYSKNKKVSYRKVADAVTKYFGKDHKALTEASFGRKQNRHETKGYNSKRWATENDVTKKGAKKVKAKARTKKARK